MKKLHNKIKNINNVEISMVAFSAIGTTCILAGSGLNVALGAVLFSSLPFAISGIINKLSFIKDKDYRVINNGFGYYLNFLKQDIKKYIESSENSVQKKYRILFIAMWCKENRIFTDTFPINSLIQYLENISISLVKDKVTTHYLDRLFYNIKDDNISALLEEDFNNYENFKIAKQVFADFKEEGFLGKQFKYLDSSTFPYLCELQDNILSNKDIVEIKKITNIESSDHNIFKFIQATENMNEKGLNSFINIYLKNLEKAEDTLNDYINKRENKEELIKLINIIKLNNKLESKLENNTKNKSIKRTKL